uniref:Uncharacterized protein n=1 Tax=Porphyridium purpureum TaxID=35688 RepID=W0S1L4_PORPP|nr:hypothetical protein Y721_p220 [Porphyridium purpureum]BAO23588.1 hypothetical protein [Porphyridium purpureum]
MSDILTTKKIISLISMSILPYIMFLSDYLTQSHKLTHILKIYIIVKHISNHE